VRPADTGGDHQTEGIMSKDKIVEHHQTAADHHEHATHHASEASKHHAEHHGTH
jgi:hypothetical protein